MIQIHRRSESQVRPAKASSPSPPPWDGNINTLELLGRGLSGMVFALDDDRVFKLGVGSETRRQEVKTEQLVYDLLDRERKAGKYSRFILRRISDDPRGLILERCKETLRDRLSAPGNARTRSQPDIKRWALQATDGLAFLHYCGIIQGDVGCHNMLLAKYKEEDDVRICDFAGSSIRGSEASVTYEAWSMMPEMEEPTVESEVFALGSAIYEMSTGKPPYHSKTRAQIRILYKGGRFPSTRDVYLGAVVEQCWRGRFTNVRQVIEAIDATWIPSYLGPAKLNQEHSKTSVRSSKPLKSPPSMHRPQSHASRSSNLSVVSDHHETGVKRGKNANKFFGESVTEGAKKREGRHNSSSRFGSWIKKPLAMFSHSSHRSSKG